MAVLEVIAPDISCEKCRSNIDSDLGALPGVREVVVDLDTKSVRVDYDEAQTSEEALRAALSEGGYPPQG